MRRTIWSGALAAAMLLAGACASRSVQVAPAAATTVAVAGSFNDWSATSHPLRRRGTSGPWVLVLTLAPGEHAFMFVVDGSRWVVPPAAVDFVDDGFGSTNGLVVVRLKEQ
jgi:1,4-alpha-glucan branching enzyme